MFLDYNRENVDRARKLRDEMTRQERKLWYCFLRKYPIRFLRQRPVGNYILDFYCASARLAVELDGGQHYEEEKLAYDARRTLELERAGIKVLRFTNLQVDREFEAVKDEIHRVIQERRNPPVAR